MITETTQQLVLETDELRIRSELDRVLSLKRFSGAPQMSAFLRYIVNETLDGHADRIKAFSVGVDALGKPDSFDAQSDPSVRVLALRLRKTLAQVYDNSNDCLAIIELRVGTYVPYFYRTSGQVRVTEKPVDHDVAAPGIVAPIIATAHLASTRHDNISQTSGVADTNPVPYEQLRHTAASNGDNTVQLPK